MSQGKPLQLVCFRGQGRIASRARRHPVDDKLQEIEQKFDRLTDDLGNPNVLADPARIAAVSKERAQLEPLVDAWRDYKKVRGEVRDHEALLEDRDAEMRQMAKDELPALRQQLAAR